MNDAPSLRELQAQFFTAIAAEPNGDATESAVLVHIDASHTQSAAERLQVYVDAYYGRLVESMRETYPKVSACIDEEAFNNLVAVYLQEHPSRHASISYAGASFAGFLDECGSLPPFIGDLARVEWARAMAFEARDEAAAGLAAVQSMTPSQLLQLRFSPVASCVTLRSAWPIDTIWREPHAEWGEQATTLRVWRTPEGQVFHSRLDEIEADAWQRMLGGETYAEICDAFADLPDNEAAQRAVSTLGSWLATGLLRLEKTEPDSAG